MPRRFEHLMLAFCAVVSVFGIFLMIIWANSPSATSDNVSWRKPLIGSLFGLICILGILASLFPSRCLGVFHFREHTRDVVAREVLSSSHHPDCGRFSAHVVRVRGRMHCAACTGLILGAVMALAGAFFYFSGGFHVENARFLSLVGVGGVLVGFLQLKFNGYIRLISNSVFVLGTFSCLVGIDQVSLSVALDLFSLVLIVFWILTRIQLSQWDHSRICDSCGIKCRFGRKMGDDG